MKQTITKSYNSLLDSNKTLQCQEIANLRAQQGLASKNVKFATYKGVGILNNPDHAVISISKIERDFVYLNLNDGDSSAYFHPVTNADIIYNFKDEPKYRTVSLDHEYFKQAEPLARKELSKANQQRLTTVFEQHKLAKTLHHCMFRDRTTDTYYAGSHDFSTSLNSFDTVSSKSAGFDFLKQHNAHKPDPVLTWDYLYKPGHSEAIDLNAGFVNKFQPSIYMRNAEKQKTLTVPDNIQRLIDSALGSDKESFDHFINWLAVIFQYKIRTQTAWVLQGTTGTGKGLLFNEIIKPLIGQQNCRSVTLENLEEQFNSFAGQCLILFIDEVDTDQIKNQQKLVAKLKNWITEPTIEVRAMRSDLREEANYLNILMASNQANSMRVEGNDRRFNVCHRQQKKLFNELESGEQFLKCIKSELQDFANYLHTHSASKNLAKTALDNSAKHDLQATTQTALEEVIEALTKGDLGYFSDMKPEGDSPLIIKFDGQIITINKQYLALLKTAVSLATKSKRHILTHKDLFTITEALVGNMPSTKGKLSKRLGHAGLKVSPHTINGKTLRGYKVNWVIEHHKLTVLASELESN